MGEDETEKFRPAQVQVEGEKFVQVSCGGMHTVALSAKGELWTFGVNDEGALGRKTGGTCWQDLPDEEKDDSTVPGKADAPEGVTFVQVAAGDGFTIALSQEGVIYGCGTFKDDVGGLSGFTAKDKMLKLLAPVFELESGSIKKIAAGARHCVALTSDGEVYTWGIGSQGQLGRLDAFDQATPEPPTADQLFAPAIVEGIADALSKGSIVDIATGSYSTYAISDSGAVVAWGLNNSGQLGMAKDGDNDNFKWRPVLVEGLKNVVGIKGGEQHSLALVKGGQVVSFGASTYGMLGRYVRAMHGRVMLACCHVLHALHAAVHIDACKLAW